MLVFSELRCDCWPPLIVLTVPQHLSAEPIPNGLELTMHARCPKCFCVWSGESVVPQMTLVIMQIAGLLHVFVMVKTICFGCEILILRQELIEKIICCFLMLIVRRKVFHQNKKLHGKLTKNAPVITSVAVLAILHNFKELEKASMLQLHEDFPLD